MRRRASRPLEGVLVLDCSRLLPGSWAAMTLADFGAEVIKVDEAPAGDDGRVAPPMYGLESVYYLVFGPPVRLSETPARIETPPPRLGEHTNAILREMGFGAAEIRRFAARGVVQQGEYPCD